MASVEFAGLRIPLPAEHRPDRAGRVVLGIRPESFEDAAFADPALPQLDATVAVLEDLGSEVHVIFPVDAPQVETEDVRPADVDEELIAGTGTVFTARVDARTAASPGEGLRLAVNPAGFYYFDPDTGLSLRRGVTAPADELILS